MTHWSISARGKGGYKKLLRKCLKKQQLFEDEDFPCENESIYFKDKPVSGKIVWKRPGVSLVHRRDSAFCCTLPCPPASL